jgi:hypothetical protein
MRYIVKTYLSKTNILIEGFSVLSSIFIEPSIPISCGQICLVYIHASTTSLKGCTIPRRSEPSVGTGGAHVDFVLLRSLASLVSTFT